MVRPVKYPIRHHVRISFEDDAKLQQISAQSGVEVAVLLRDFVTAGIDREFKKEGSDGLVQSKEKQA